MYQENVDYYMNFGDDKQFYYGIFVIMGMFCSLICFMGDVEGICVVGMLMFSELVFCVVIIDVEWICSDIDIFWFGVGV